jgi:tricarballylate dehydrogenase
LDLDVLVVGGGNAALCAAMAAKDEGARRVKVLEVAPRHARGGNSRHTRNVRYVHDGPVDGLTGPYLEDEFWSDLLRVTGGETDERMARFCIRESRTIGRWMSAHGIRWQGPLRGTLHLSRTNAFFLGGGTALVNTYYQTAARLGVEVAYESEVVDLAMSGGRFLAAITKHGDEIAARTVVVAAGGFEANIDWHREYWGDAAANFMVRGTPYNQGRMLRVLLDAGASAVGNPREWHAVACDARGPRFDGGIVTRLDCIPFGIVVDKHARRFADEGQDLWPKRYASWGGLVARQPDQKAYVLFDDKVVGSFMPSVYPAIEADSVRGLAAALGLDADALSATVDQYNAAVRPGTYDQSRLDDCRTEGLDPPKSHWALTIDRPPFYAYPLCPGITFTYLGVAVDEQARVLMQDGSPADNVFAAGEVMAGNILGRGYLAGFGMTIGTVFGRIAGREAARRALR